MMNRSKMAARMMASYKQESQSFCDKYIMCSAVEPELPGDGMN